jgi:hypothetical protein
MRISFDLDDTLICRQASAKHENHTDLFLLKIIFNDSLRLGTRFLFRHLLEDGHEVWIYTSSYRKPLFVKLWLRFYGIRVSKVINQEIYNRQMILQNDANKLSKNPKLFEIDLHVDDLHGVKMEGDRHGFRVLVIDPNDVTWVDKVIRAVKNLESLKS